MAGFLLFLWKKKSGFAVLFIQQKGVCTKELLLHVSEISG